MEGVNGPVGPAAESSKGMTGPGPQGVILEISIPLGLNGPGPK